MSPDERARLVTELRSLRMAARDAYRDLDKIDTRSPRPEHIDMQVKAARASVAALGRRVSAMLASLPD